MRIRFLSLTLVAALAACGGSSSNNNTNTGGGALTARTLEGEITSVDSSSITVNGVRTDDSAIASGKILIDDNPSSHDQLKPGQVVTVTIDDKGKTTEIRHRSELRGKLDATPGASTATIGGQTVIFDDSTHFDDDTRKLSSATASTRVRVSGYWSAHNNSSALRATRIETESGSSEDFEIRGIVQSVTTNSFTLKTSTAATTTYTVNITPVPAGVVQNALVEVRAAAKPSGTTITATSVTVDDDSLGGQGHEAEVEGIVLSGTSASFVIGTRTVTTSATTKWVGGAPADLIPGVKAEAEGTVDASGNIAASKVVFKDSLRFQSVISAVVPATGAGTGSVGTFKMLGGTLTVHVSDATEFESSGLTSFAGLTNQNIEVRGYQSVAGAQATGAGVNDIVATRIKIGTGGGGGGGSGGGTSTRVVIQGPIANYDANAQSFSILGYTIVAKGATSLSRVDDNPLSDPSAAFTGLSNGTVVKVRGDTEAAFSASTLTLTAKEIEVEDDR